MTQRELFKKIMVEKGFETYDFEGQHFCGRFNLLPTHYKDNDSNHVIVNSINYTIYGGSNTKKGDLGCVIFYYSGKKRKKYHRNVSSNEIEKVSKCPKTVKEAIKIYNKWTKDTRQKINTWQVVL